jgi:hypothetical protein
MGGLWGWEAGCLVAVPGGCVVLLLLLLPLRYVDDVGVWGPQASRQGPLNGLEIPIYRQAACCWEKGAPYKARAKPAERSCSRRAAVVADPSSRPHHLLLLCTRRRLPPPLLQALCACLYIWSVPRRGWWWFLPDGRRRSLDRSIDPDRGGQIFGARRASSAGWGGFGYDDAAVR